jgi:serine/threonine protein phosphatase PrpC
LILCSDGLWGKVEAEEIKEFTDRYEPQAACENLVRLANERGGEDNVTVIVASFSGDGLPLSQGRDIAPPDTAKRRRRWWWLWLR